MKINIDKLEDVVFFEKRFIEIIKLTGWILGVVIPGLYSLMIFGDNYLLVYFGITQTLENRLLALLVLIPYFYIIALVIGPIILFLRVCTELVKSNENLEKLISHSNSHTLELVKSNENLKSLISNSQQLQVEKNNNFLKNSQHSMVIIDNMKKSEVQIDQTGIYNDYFISAFLIFNYYQLNEKPSHFLYATINIRGNKNAKNDTPINGNLELMNYEGKVFLGGTLNVMDEFIAYLFEKWRTQQSKERADQEVLSFLLKGSGLEIEDDAINLNVDKIGNIAYNSRHTMQFFLNKNWSFIKKISTQHCDADRLDELFRAKILN